MANKLATELLKLLSESLEIEKAVTTTLDAKSLAIVEKYRLAGKSIKATCAELLAVADEALEEAKRTAGSAKYEQIDERTRK